MKPKHLLALGVLAGVAAASLAAAQKPAPQLTEQQKLKERVDILDADVKALKEKADRAAMEKDYIEHIQTEAKDYYNKAFLTQVAIVSIIALFITVVLAITARFGLTIFDRHITQAVTNATTELETRFDQRLKDATRVLKHSSGAQFKELEAANAARMNQLEDDLNCRLYFNFYVAQGQAAGADGRHEEALDSFRRGLKTYKSGKARQLFTTENGGRAVRNILSEYRQVAQGQARGRSKKRTG